jgi:hypothetical protein
MIFYHFTNLLWLREIEKVGLNRGDIPASKTTMTNGVWLTTDGDCNNQGWAGKLKYCPGNSGFIIDKTFVRLTINVSENDSLLISWSEYAMIAGVPKRWNRSLDRVGGKGSNNWYIYLGKIPIEKIIKKEFREEYPPELIEKEYNSFIEKYALYTSGLIRICKRK